MQHLDYDRREANSYFNAKEVRSWFLLVAAVLICLACGIFALRENQELLLTGFDGAYMQDLARRQFAWNVPLFSTSMDWFQGLGDIFFPVNFRLFPAFVAASHLQAGTLAKCIVYAIVLVELTVAAALFGCALRVPKSVAVASALAICLITSPISGPSLIYSTLFLAPNAATAIAATLGMAAAFLRFGRGWLLSDLPFAALSLALLGWILTAPHAAIVLVLPFALFVIIVGFVGASSNRERMHKLGLVLFAFVLLAAVAPFLAGYFLNTAAAVFPSEMMNDRATTYYGSILFHRVSVGPTGPTLIVLAVAGCVQTIFEKEPRLLRVTAIGLLGYLFVSLFLTAATVSFDFWRGPSPLYLESFFVPLYTIFAVLFVGRLFAGAASYVGWQPPSESRILSMLFVVSGALAIVLSTTSKQIDFGFSYPPKSTTLSDTLRRSIGAEADSRFRGRAANMTGRGLAGDVTWFDLHINDASINKRSGNPLRLFGLHYFGIPDLFEYTPGMTPAFYVTTTRLLARAGDRQMRNVSVLRHVDPRILAMLGVAYVVTDAPIPPAEASGATMVVSSDSLELYEIANPNLGNYSPTRPRKAVDATQAIRLLSASSFDPSQEVIVDTDVALNGLVKADEAQLSFDGVGLRLEAHSRGRSILLLPLEFSRCLRITASRSGYAELFRANLLETGVVFEGLLDVTIAIRWGLFLNPTCRLRDYFDVKALRIGEVPPKL